MNFDIQTLKTKKNELNLKQFLNCSLLLLGCRSDDSGDEIDDNDLDKILIVMQTPPALRKHPGGDRTGDYTKRSKITAELSKVINDGLFYYEKDLWDNEFMVS